MSSPQVVLVVEDVDPIRALFELLFKLKGFTVRVAHDGRSALEELDGAAAHPALVVLDFCLPDTDTLELLAQMRERCPGVPVLLTSGQPLDELPAWVGQFAFLPKPFSFDAVARRVDSLLPRVAVDSHAAS